MVLLFCVIIIGIIVFIISTSSKEQQKYEQKEKEDIEKEVIKYVINNNGGSEIFKIYRHGAENYAEFYSKYNEVIINKNGKDIKCKLFGRSLSSVLYREFANGWRDLKDTILKTKIKGINIKHRGYPSHNGEMIYWGIKLTPGESYQVTVNGEMKEYIYDYDNIVYPSSSIIRPYFMDEDFERIHIMYNDDIELITKK